MVDMKCSITHFENEIKAYEEAGIQEKEEGLDTLRTVRCPLTGSLQSAK